MKYIIVGKLSKKETLDSINHSREELGLDPIKPIKPIKVVDIGFFFALCMMLGLI